MVAAVLSDDRVEGVSFFFEPTEGSGRVFPRLGKACGGGDFCCFSSGLPAFIRLSFLRVPDFVPVMFLSAGVGAEAAARRAFGFEVSAAELAASPDDLRALPVFAEVFTGAFRCL